MAIKIQQSDDELGKYEMKRKLDQAVQQTNQAVILAESV